MMVALLAALFAGGEARKTEAFRGGKRATTTIEVSSDAAKKEVLERVAAYAATLGADEAGYKAAFDQFATGGTADTGGTVNKAGIVQLLNAAGVSITVWGVGVSNDTVAGKILPQFDTNADAAVSWAEFQAGLAAAGR